MTALELAKAIADHTAARVSTLGRNVLVINDSSNSGPAPADTQLLAFYDRMVTQQPPAGRVATRVLKHTLRAIQERSLGGALIAVVVTNLDAEWQRAFRQPRDGRGDA
jgi:hypothetical protein